MPSLFDSVDNFFESHADSAGGILFEVLVVVYCFFALAIVCDEYLAPALETLCVHWGVREDVAGATFLAFGSAAPEIVINAVATIKSQVTASNTTSLGISAIIGSGMLAFSFIPAMCCFTSPLELRLKRRPLLRDESFYLIALFTLCAAFHDGKIVFLESVFLVLIYGGHLATVVTSPWVRQTYRYKVKGISMKPKSAQDSFVHKAKAELERQRSLKKAKSLEQILPNHSVQRPNLKRAATINALLTAATETSHTSVNGTDESIDYAKLPAFALNSCSDIETETEIGIGLSTNDSMAQAVAVKSTDTDYYYDNDSDSDSESESEDSIGSHIMHWVTLPLQLLFKCTCPPAGEGQPCEKLYFLTFFIGVCHVAVFSFILSSIVGAWVVEWGMPQALFGMLLIAIGAEIPDTIESVTMARKAYGSMAVSNCQGTQVINIGIGLGLPWLLTNLTGNHVFVCGHNILQVSAIFQTCIVLVNFALLVGLALLKKENKAAFHRWKAYTLVVLYFVAMLGFTLYLFFSDQLFKDTCT